MNKKLMFVLFAMLMMAVMTVSVSADQLANDRWCNSDQYGCWVTGDDGAQDYIMFWSESARDLFMGPGSNAVVTDPYTAGKMPLDPPAGPPMTWKDYVSLFCDLYFEKFGESFHGGADSLIKTIERNINYGYTTESRMGQMYASWVNEIRNMD